MMDLRLILDVAVVMSACAMVIQEFLLWREVRKANQNFIQVRDTLQENFKKLEPLFKALQKAQPVLEIVNMALDLFRNKKKRK